MRHEHTSILIYHLLNNINAYKCIYIHFLFLISTIYIGMTPDVYQEVANHCYQSLGQGQGQSQLQSQRQGQGHYGDSEGEREGGGGVGEGGGEGERRHIDPEVTYPEFLKAARTVLSKHNVRIKGGHVLDRVCIDRAYNVARPPPRSAYDQSATELVTGKC